jgi:uncharacterized membrane protein
MKFNDRQWLAIIFLLCLIYIALRFWNLAASCLWFDEIFSVHAAEHDWNSLFWFVAQDLIHPPLFYLLLKIWISIGGESVFWLRLLPVIFSIIALIPFYFLCRELKLKHSTIALALTFLAANGALIKYSQEVRMYSPLFCLSLFSIWLFARFLNSGRSYAALIIVNILLVYTHYFGWLVVLSEFITIIFLQKTKIRQILIMCGAAILSFAPWIFAIWQASKINADVVQNIGWMDRPTIRIIFLFVFDVIEPFYYQQSSDYPTSIFLITVPLLLLIGAAKIFYFVDWKDNVEKQALYLLSIFVALPILLVFFASWTLPVSIWGSRHLIIAFSPMLILAAKFLTEIRIHLVKIIFLNLLFLLFGAAFAIHSKTGQPKFFWCVWEELARGIETNNSPKIYVFEDLTAYHFWFATRKNGGNVQIFKVKNVERIEEDTAYFLPRDFDGIKTIDGTGIVDEQLWIAFRDEDWNKTKPPLLNFIQKGYEIGEPTVIEVKGLKAYLVEAKK